ncbi:helix-turn-helix domain-containing protein [Streptomyces noursei]|uniref:helix-turn-helix domain-containing protein n=1 Tax=Streptomyces noursei TaxID=1971 RepID=UPI0036D380B7
MDPENPLHAFARELKELRHEAGATGGPKPTCIAVGISRSTYYAWLSGKQLPEQDLLERAVKHWGGDTRYWTRRRSQMVDRLTVELPQDVGELPAHPVDVAFDYLGSVQADEYEAELNAHLIEQSKALTKFYYNLKGVYIAAGRPRRESVSLKTYLSPQAVADVFMGHIFKPPEETYRDHCELIEGLSYFLPATPDRHLTQLVEETRDLAKKVAENARVAEELRALKDSLRPA